MTAPADSKPKPSETPDAADAPVSKKEMRRAFTVNEAWTVIVALGTAAAALLGSYAIFIDKAEAAGRKAAESVAEDVAKLKADQSETRLDVRALYRVVITGQRSPRLESPLPSGDGGL